VSVVEVVRGGVVESRHRVHVAVRDVDGGAVASLGDPTVLTFHRSAAKPIQALPLVEEGVVDRFGMTPAELALCCASHEGEPLHVTTALSILDKAGADERPTPPRRPVPSRRPERSRAASTTTARASTPG
jgi:L-asparaginase II